ncbi:TetR/AcrR family transcriptional regulator [Eubacterium ruminantium]|uniref:TetR/AcrR family transcriptional regulator n=1 Tax=Eubacterium ruminantium TaxID=42322 RepID=UPI001569825A|nr:TetR/AcrR family transcriptional regulator [Eubacterium ruminantium]
MNRTNGIIAEKSKQKMADALFSIMSQYEYREITITQIAQESGLSRKTFYRLFSKKEDILKTRFSQWFQEIFDRIREEQLHSYWDVVQCYFDFCENHKESLELLTRHNLLNLFFDFLDQNALTVFEVVHSKQIAEKNAQTLPYMLSYSVGGMFSMLVKWVENGMDIPSEELLRILRASYMNPNL